MNCGILGVLAYLLNNGNNNLIYKAPYGCNFRGTGDTADKFSYMLA